VRPQRACRQPHGTVARYISGCSCFECCEEWRRYQAEWKADSPRLVDAEPVRAYIVRLRHNGWRTRGIAEQSGIPYATVRALREGRRVKVNRDAAEAIASLPLQTPILTDSTALVPARSTLRLIERLRKHHSLERIAAEVGISRKSLPQKWQHSVQARTARKVREAADRLQGRAVA
jgi:hypothetical protein